MRSLPVKLILLAGLMAMVYAAVPTTASAHTLTTRGATNRANAACQAISNNPNTPYFCRGVVDRSRRSRHRVDFLLDLYDPNDGEECAAVVRIYIRAGSFRIRRGIVDHNCIIRPTFN